MPTDAELLPPGTCLDQKWIVGRLLGKGGMGMVYAATHVRTQARAAIKVLHGDLARDESLRGRFLTEGRAANLVGHPGAVGVLDDGLLQGRIPYLVMELLEGEPSDVLAEDLRHGFTDPLGAEALAYFERLAWLRDHDVLTARFAVRAAFPPSIGHW